MECAAAKPSSSSNISEFVSKFAKVCRLRSVGFGVKPSSIPLVAEDGSDSSTQETDWDSCDKVHPHPHHHHPIEEVQVQLQNGFVAADILLITIFNTVSALKLAYLQLQNAHIPHNPQKIRAADDLVVNQLRVLSKIKRSYYNNKEKRFKILQSDESKSAEIQLQEKLLGNLKSQAKERDTDILCLRRELQELNNALVLMDDKLLLQKKAANSSSSFLLQDVVEAVSKSVHDFAKPLIGLMKASGWDLNLAANAVEESVVYSQRSHKKYAFEAYIARRMFCGLIKLQSYDDVDAAIMMRFDDPIDDALVKVEEDPNSCFAKFCQNKYLLVIHPKMEASFFGNLDHRSLMSSGKHPRTLFYQAFVKMAKWVWVLQGIVGSIHPKAEIFRVKRGTEFSDTYMESVAEDKRAPGGGQAGFKVEFTVLPGFKIGETTLVKSQVYLSKLIS